MKDTYAKKQQAKLALVVQNFFTKSAQVILESRRPEREPPTHTADSEPQDPAEKLNKWFNLHMRNDEAPILKGWKGADRPMIIETYLDLRLLEPGLVVTLTDDGGSEWTVTRTGGRKQEVVLERWLVEFEPTDSDGVDELPLVYKQAIILFRSMYAFARLMPCYSLRRHVENGLALVMANKVLDGKQPISSKGRIGLSRAIVPLNEPHVSHKHFRPIHTAQGVLKVSIAYRNQCGFGVRADSGEEDKSKESTEKEVKREREGSLDKPVVDVERSSDRTSLDQASSIEKPSDRRPSAERHDRLVSIERPSDRRPSSEKPSGYPLASAERHDRVSNEERSFDRTSISVERSPSPAPVPNEIKRLSMASSLSMSVSPSSKPKIQPFRVGLLGASPGRVHGHGPLGTTPVTTQHGHGTQNSPGPGPELDRRISLTSNKSTSNASLAALLRNPRGLVSSTNTPTIPIQQPVQFQSSFPRLVSLLHGSNMEEFENPRFLSSFGLRASRRFSNASANAGIGAGMRPALMAGADLGTSLGLLPLLGTPFLGLYVDDDISDFVRMIDSKSELKLGERERSGSGESRAGIDLSRFQLLRSQHDQLSDSVSASLVLPHGSGMTRTSSRKSSHSRYLPPVESYDMPSITSRLKDLSPETHGSRSSGEADKTHSGPNASFLKLHATKVLATPVVSNQNVSSVGKTTVTHRKKKIHYADVFDDDDDGEGEYRRDDDDDLLFTMSDMNLTK